MIDECTLKADNYAVAAQIAKTAADKCVLMQLAALFRNEALRLRLGAHADAYLMPNPLTSESFARWEMDLSPAHAPGR
jgi:hypothetical protein